MRRRALIWTSLAGGLMAGAGLGLSQRPVRQTPNVSSPPVISPPPATPASTPTVLTVAEAPQGLWIPSRRDVRLMVISDMNSMYGSVDYDPEVDRAMALLPHWDPDIVLGGGDMVAGQDPRLKPERIRAMWQAFDQHVAAPLRQAKLPYGFTVGNHDASSALSVTNKFLFQQERDLASEYWNDPDHDPGVEFVDRAGFPFYYTFRHRDIFYLVWDASSNRIPPEQITWAETSLASELAQSAKLRMVIGHLPLYAISVGRDEPGEVLSEADQKRELLERYRVHTYISGHHHSYYPGHKGQLQLLHSGILGSGPRPLVNSPLPPRKTLTLVDVDFQKSDTIYTTYNMQTLVVIDQGELPRFLTGHNGLVLRRDVEWQDLTPQEITQCQSRIGDRCQA
ncbi:MAG: metallophosphoesterase [Cyanobacteriota bacterium]|nr:metallophosphoesterase [Cyanobacteriota bacterium]